MAGLISHRENEKVCAMGKHTNDNFNANTVVLRVTLRATLDRNRTELAVTVAWNSSTRQNASYTLELQAE